LGFFDGVAAFFRGAAFVVKQPAVWAWAAVPVVVATTMLVALGGLSYWGAAELAERLFAGAGGSAWAGFGAVALRIVLSLTGLVLAFLLSTTLAQPISGFALEAIARRQELALGERPRPAQPLLTSAVRSLVVTLTALAISLPILGVLALVTFAFPPAGTVTVPLKFLVTGVAVAYDFLDYPLSVRGAGALERLRFIRRHFAAVVGFGATGALLLLVPGIGLLLLPFGVAGATRMVAEADRRAA
jgi:uncharacterized protein involved in cysteine biosynthesis